MLTELVETDLALMVRDADGHLVIAYQDSGGTEHEYAFSDPEPWVRVEVGPVFR